MAAHMNLDDPKLNLIELLYSPTFNNNTEKFVNSLIVYYQIKSQFVDRVAQDIDIFNYRHGPRINKDQFLRQLNELIKKNAEKTCDQLGFDFGQVVMEEDSSGIGALSAQFSNLARQKPQIFKNRQLTCECGNTDPLIPGNSEGMESLNCDKCGKYTIVESQFHY